MTLDQAGCGRSTLIVLRPPLHLRGIIDFFWIDERHRPPQSMRQWRIVADDAPHVIYARFLDQDGCTESHRLHVVGARRRYADIDCSRRLLTVGARLRAGAIPALFDLPAGELTDQSLAAELLVRDPSRRSLAQLEGESSARVIDHLTEFLGVLLIRGRAIDPRAHLLAGPVHTAMTSVRAVAHRLGIGERALRTWSSAHLGLGLRRFMSIRRLHRALEARLADPMVTWSRVAALTGYADQPHLVRDCRALLGETPGEFLARAG